MAITIKAYSNCDHTYVVWKPDKRITGCLGFALIRKPKGGTEVVVETWVGFSSDPDATPGTHKPSTQWPVQKFMWSDYMAEPGQELQYQVVPMIGSENALKRADSQASGWSAPVIVASQGNKINPYFNRGIVASQWLARKLQNVPAKGWRKKLTTSLSTPGDPIRNFLSGASRVELLALLNGALKSGGQIYAVLYELDDPELIAALKSLGKRSHLILANGTHKSKSGSHADENAAARAQLAKVVSLSNRMVTGEHLAHNKFLVLADANGVAQKIWTGSTNWTLTGLCTQANNGILFDAPTIAKLYLDQWNRLKAAGDAFPPALIASNTEEKTAKIDNRPVTVWFAPVRKQVDLASARAFIQAAKQGVLFLVFDPGPKGTLLNDILALDSNKLYIHGVLNQDPGGKKQPLIKLVHRGHVVTPPDDVVLPAAIDDRLKFWIPEMKSFTIVMVHSKLIVVDPFGDHPVVMTGSHNLGPKASTENDDNLVIVENDPALAAQYAVNVMTVYNQYRWRYFRSVSKPPDRWDGLVSADSWQDDYFQGEKLRELQFWMGTASGVATPRAKTPRKPAAKVRAKVKR
jgi:phosphatidylserine/phosphatidylglycerophosphate/cardiolipin synthase-like enzyme